MYVDDDLTWRSHINFVCASLSSSSYLMSQFAKYRHVQLLKITYFGLVESRLRFHCANVVDGAAIHDHNTRARVDLRQTQHRSALAGGLPQNSGAREIAFVHGVWDSLADYPLNPLRATEGPGRNPFG
ncbi:hypothetical protein J6590_090431 [Homalodisca vitripennis]|nr:hypothetical protein J6590_086679 [Homalodisca vitripennis]KAG8324518.1 hypothetical protein J6590_090431 [Homalodisca vitripennis]